MPRWHRQQKCLILLRIHKEDGMARPMSYKDLEKNNQDKERELLRLKQNMQLLHKGAASTERHYIAHDFIIECVALLLSQQRFVDTALCIFNKCKLIIGAESGFVALIDESGKHLDVLHLDTGGLACAASSASPMPIRGFRKQTLQKGAASCCNDFNKSKWMKLLPKGHIKLHNVLLAPVVIEGHSAGLLGFANKPEDFDQDDLRIASSFAKLAALALSKSRAWYFMKKERFAILDY